jgi:hypothetical protein
LSFNYHETRLLTYKIYSALFKELRDHQKHVDFQQRYIQLNDSLHSEKLTQNLMVTQAEYDQKDNVSRIESQKQILVLKEEFIQSQKL